MVEYRDILLPYERRSKYLRVGLFLFSALSFIFAVFTLYVSDASYYSMIYTAFSFAGTLSATYELITRKGLPVTYLFIYGSTFFSSHIILLISASFASRYHLDIQYLIALTIIYILYMYFREYKYIISRKKFNDMAKSAFRKIGVDRYMVDDGVISHMIDLSFIKRESDWILVGWKGYVQRVFIGIMIFMLLLIFNAAYVNSDFKSASLAFSIFSIIFAILARPMFLEHILMQKVRVMKYKGKI